ncbi:MAG: TlpA family protein disulfide reductase [Cyclobacteriaceae bacterium]|nr:TlpA family protein disulfide reductase [Cyclobacteriaceae bacterium]
MRVKNFLLPVFAALLLSACKKEPVVTKIRSEVLNVEPGTEIKLTYLSDAIGYENREPISTVTTDSLGHFQMETTIDKPGYYSLSGVYVRLYLKPGFDFTIRGDYKNRETELAFEGNGAAYQQTMLHLDKSMFVPFRDLVMREPAAFEDTLKFIFDQATHLLDSVQQQINDDLFVNSQKAFLQAKKSEWYTYYSNYYKYYTGKEPEYTPDSLKTYWSVFEQHATAGMLHPDYRNTVNTYYRDLNYVASKVYRKSNEVEQIPDSVLIQLEKEVLSKISNSDLRELAFASYVKEYVSFSGIDNLGDRFDWFKSNFPKSAYTPRLQQAYDKWLKLAKGNVAPNYEGLSPDSLKRSLADYKGKVVYVDVWATWCGPCRAEFPNSKILKNEYRDEEDLVFMYVSIDSDKSAWKKYLTNDPEFAGEHLFVEGAWNSEICKTYNIMAIPRYLLIDKDGKIADSNAPRPSSGDVIRNAINALL